MPIDPICDDPTPILTSKASLEPASVSNPVSPASEVTSDDGTSQDTREQAEEDIFSDIESGSISSDSCTSTCCAEVSVRTLTYRARVLAYLDFPSYFTEEVDQVFAAKYMNNIFRYVISRIPSLLVRAKNANCSEILCFLESEDLGEAEFGRLWRGFKYNNVHTEGKLSVNAIRNALSEAEGDMEDRTGPCLELLGGKVWKDGSQRDLSRRAWDHFYRFVSPNAASVIHTRTHSKIVIDELLWLCIVSHILVRKLERESLPRPATFSVSCLVR